MLDLINSVDRPAISTIQTSIEGNTTYLNPLEGAAALLMFYLPPSANTCRESENEISLSNAEITSLKRSICSSATFCLKLFLDRNAYSQNIM